MRIFMPCSSYLRFDDSYFLSLCSISSLGNDNLSPLFPVLETTTMRDDRMVRNALLFCEKEKKYFSKHAKGLRELLSWKHWTIICSH